MTERIRRSALYLPGSNARAIEKAKSIPADALILDLEDAVAPDSKQLARRQACEAVKSGAYPRHEVVIRVNALSTPWGEEDLAAACAARPDAILTPKVETPEDIVALSRRMDDLGAPPSVRIWAMMETPRAVLNALTIADSARDRASRLATFVIGSNDLAKDTRIRLDKDRVALLPWLSACVAAARANGLAILDGVFNNIDDGEGFVRECEQGRQFGMDGKTLVHPGQVEPCNRIYSPTAEEVAWAQAVAAGFDDPAHANAGVVRINGQMVERLHLEVARRILSANEKGATSPRSPE